MIGTVLAQVRTLPLPVLHSSVQLRGNNRWIQQAASDATARSDMLRGTPGASLYSFMYVRARTLVSEKKLPFWCYDVLAMYMTIQNL